MRVILVSLQWPRVAYSTLSLKQRLGCAIGQEICFVRPGSVLILHGSRSSPIFAMDPETRNDSGESPPLF